MDRRALLAMIGIMTALPAAARAQTVLYSDNLDSTSGSAYSVIFSNATAGYGAATFGFDYGTLGIPSAPNSAGGTTLGLKLEANKIVGSGVLGGVSVAPTTSPIPAGSTNYAVRFDLWMNANGAFPAGGTGSTQHSGVSIGTTGATHQFPGTSGAPAAGNVDGVTFLADGEGGSSGTTTTSARDYNAWVNPGLFLNNTGYAATGTNPQDNANAYYAGFGGVTPPAAQGGNQTGTTAVGSQGFEWHTWTVTREGDTVRWSIRDRAGADVLISTVDVSAEPLAGTNFTLGQYDFFTSVAPVADQPFLFGLFDNVVVFTPVPEPAGLVASGFAAVGLIRLARRRRQVDRSPITPG